MLSFKSGNTPMKVMTANKTRPLLSTQLGRVYDTPLKTNIYPENQWLEDVFPPEIVPF